MRAGIVIVCHNICIYTRVSPQVIQLNIIQFCDLATILTSIMAINSTWRHVAYQPHAYRVIDGALRYVKELPARVPNWSRACRRLRVTSGANRTAIMALLTDLPQLQSLQWNATWCHQIPVPLPSLPLPLLQHLTLSSIRCQSWPAEVLPLLVTLNLYDCHIDCELVTGAALTHLRLSACLTTAVDIRASASSLRCVITDESSAPWHVPSSLVSLTHATLMVSDAATAFVPLLASAVTALPVLDTLILRLDDTVSSSLHACLLVESGHDDGQHGHCTIGSLRHLILIPSCAAVAYDALAVMELPRLVSTTIVTNQSLHTTNAVTPSQEFLTRLATNDIAVMEATTRVALERELFGDLSDSDYCHDHGDTASSPAVRMCGTISHPVGHTNHDNNILILEAIDIHDFLTTNDQLSSSDLPSRSGTSNIPSVTLNGIVAWNYFSDEHKKKSIESSAVWYVIQLAHHPLLHLSVAPTGDA
jgi:hypothetical protein